MTSKTGTWHKTTYVTRRPTLGFTSHLNKVQSNSKEKKTTLQLKTIRNSTSVCRHGGEGHPCWPELHSAVVYQRSGQAPGRLPVFQPNLTHCCAAPALGSPRDPAVRAAPTCILVQASRFVSQLAFLHNKQKTQISADSMSEAFIFLQDMGLVCVNIC